MADRSCATASSLVAWLPAIALQLRERIPTERCRREIAAGQDTRRRALPGHRLLEKQPALHRRFRKVPQFHGNAGRPEEGAFSCRSHHRSTYCSGGKRWLRPVRFGSCGRSLCEESGRFDFCGESLAGSLSFSRFHPAKHSSLVGWTLCEICI